MARATKRLRGEPCPCGLEQTYDACCGKYHRGEAFAPTAERLMRSRYSAFVKEDKVYLQQTWDPEFCPVDLSLEPTKWLGLKIKSTKLGGTEDSEGWVEFIARYKVEGKAERIEEHSYFKRLNNRWVYVKAENAGASPA